jgi:hypothetical protein
MSDPQRKIDPMTPAQLLHFEQHHPHHTPTKTHAIHTQLGITEIRYYTLLLRAAHSREGIAANPHTARIIRERAHTRAQRRHARTAA